MVTASDGTTPSGIFFPSRPVFAKHRRKKSDFFHKDKEDLHMHAASSLTPLCKLKFLVSIW